MSETAMTPEQLVEKVARELARSCYGAEEPCWSEKLPEARAAIAVVIEEAASVVEQNIVGWFGGEPSLRPRPKGDVQALQYVAAIRALAAGKD